MAVFSSQKVLEDKQMRSGDTWPEDRRYLKRWELVGGNAGCQSAEPGLNVVAKSDSADQHNQTDRGDQEAILNHILTLVFDNKISNAVHRNKYSYSLRS